VSRSPQPQPAEQPRARLKRADSRKRRGSRQGKGRFRVKQGFDDPLPEDVLRLFED